VRNNSVVLNSDAFDLCNFAWAANFRAFISGSQERTSDRPCHVVLMVWFIFSFLFSQKFRKFQDVIQVFFLQNVSPLRKAVGSGIDFLIMLASRMLLPMNLGSLVFVEYKTTI
jgi:hypothetical protein